MSIIAWDGKTIAADKQSTYADVKETTYKKIFAVLASRLPTINEGTSFVSASRATHVHTSP
ncbi:MAG: hypothetical protein WC389_22420 [Lutibacter sp.]